MGDLRIGSFPARSGRDADTVLVNNPYGVAFSLGRRDQLNVSSAELKRAWDAVTDDQLRRAAREVFAPEHRAAVFIAVEK